MKSSKRTCQQYFNVDLETENDVKSVVCFSPSKRSLFQSAVETCRGCEIQNVTVKEDESTVFVSEYSTIRNKELGFRRTNEHDYKTVSEVLNEVPVDTQVNVQGALELDLVRFVTVNGEEVPIREGHLVDESGNIKITLWREYTELQSGTTYDFLHLIKLRYAGDVVLQTIHTTTYQVSITQLQDYEVPERTNSLSLHDVTVMAIKHSVSNACGICKVAAIPSSQQLYTGFENWQVRRSETG